MECHVAKIPQLLPTDADAVFVVTGGNRGLGLEHVRQFLEKTKAHIIVTVRKSSDTQHLTAFARQGHGKRFTLVHVDASDESSIEVRAAQRLLLSSRGFNSRESPTASWPCLCRQLHRGLPKSIRMASICL